jgi:hypothetical protein
MVVLPFPVFLRIGNAAPGEKKGVKRDITSSSVAWPKFWSYDQDDLVYVYTAQVRMCKAIDCIFPVCYYITSRGRREGRWGALVYLVSVLLGESRCGVQLV